MRRILVTGANGFIGAELCKRLLSEGYRVIAAVRQAAAPTQTTGLETITIGNIDGQTDWVKGVQSVDVVVHLAARVHVMADHAGDPLDAYRQVNVNGTRKLAESAAEAGVRRFIYMSSIKVNGDGNTKAYDEFHQPSPEDAYGISKMEAEIQLKAIASKSNMEVVIIRPPLVYGPGVKANFLDLMKLVNWKVPLPLSGINNHRSLIYLGNLVDCIIKCMTHGAAGGQTYLVSDDRDVSTPELIRLIAAALKTKSLLFPFPKSLLHAVGNLLGKGETIHRLFGSLTVDITKIKRDLAWNPPVSLEYGLFHTAKWFKEQ